VTNRVGANSYLTNNSSYTALLRRDTVVRIGVTTSRPRFDHPMYRPLIQRGIGSANSYAFGRHVDERNGETARHGPFERLQLVKRSGFDVNRSDSTLEQRPFPTECPALIGATSSLI
jgi:hypothetical protein